MALVGKTTGNAVPLSCVPAHVSQPHKLARPLSWVGVHCQTLDSTPLREERAAIGHSRHQLQWTEGDKVVQIANTHATCLTRVVGY